MEDLYIPGTDKTFTFNLKPGFLHIQGCSYPPSASVSFRQAHEWVKKYVENPNPITIMDCDFECCDSSSARELTDLLYLLMNGIKMAGKELRVRWRIDDDEDLLILAEAIEQRLNLRFEYYK